MSNTPRIRRNAEKLNEKNRVRQQRREAKRRHERAKYGPVIAGPRDVAVVSSAAASLGAYAAAALLAYGRIGRIADSKTENHSSTTPGDNS